VNFTTDWTHSVAFAHNPQNCIIGQFHMVTWAHDKSLATSFDLGRVAVQLS
jgi:hypothetical protein